MKKLLIIIITLFFCAKLSAQNIGNYFFSSLNGTFNYLPTSATAPALASGSANEGLYPSIQLGFDFFYLGRRITSVQASTNGWLILGTNTSTSPVASNNFNSFSLPSDLVAPLWDDLDMSSGSFRHQTSGSAPNRVFTAEWRNAEWNWNTNTPVITFQVKLFEGTGIIQFEYAQEPGNVAGASASIGIRGQDINSNTAFISLTSAGSNPTSSSSISTNNINGKPATGQIYRFSNATVTAPINFGFNSRTITSMNITWTDNVTNETGFVIYRSTDNINFIFEGTTSANTSFYTVSNLISGTTYFYRIFAVNEGRLSTALTGSVSTLTGTLSGTLNVPGNYNSISAALNALRTQGMAGPVVIQLNPTYNNSLETYPINVTGLGTAPNRTLTIRPASNVSSLVLSSPANTAVFTVNTTSNFIIDGRPGGTGSSRALTLLCNNGSNTIRYFDDCSNDTIRFCRIGLNDNGSGAFPASSNIVFTPVFGYLTGANNNAIVNNEIFGINPPSGLITFYAPTNVISQNNTISNNILYDFAGNLRFFFFSNAAIYIDGAYNNFKIINNSIFQTQSISAASSFGGPYTLGGIRVNAANASSFIISNNIIGGSNSTATGSPWELGPVSDFNAIIPIDISLQSTTGFEITNNIIRNFFLGSSATFGVFPAFCGIRFSSTAKATGVNISNNSIGRDTGNTSISIINEGSSLMLATGIIIDAPDTSTVTCNSNSIGSINMTGPGSGNGFQFIGICMQSSGTISNNLIGSLTTNNSIIAANTASATQQSLVGISTTLFQQFALRNESISITGNTISGLRNNFNASTNIDRLVGIDAFETRAVNISNNIVQRLNAFSPSVGNNFYPVKGMQITNAAFINQQNTAISGNIIRDINNLSALGLANIGGIIINSTSIALYDVTRNFIHSFNAISNNSNTQITGMLLQDGEFRLTNNMVRLGINASGLAVDAPALICGIDINTGDNTSFWHNTIYIGGTIINSVSNSYALRRNGNGSLNLTNNILVNQRTFTSGTIRKNFTIGLSTTNAFTANHNCYFRLGNGTGLAEVGNLIYDSILTWRNASGGDGVSGIVNPNFINPTGNIQTVDLHVFGTTPIESNGSLIAAVTVDFDGQIRNSLTPVDIGADAGLFSSIPLPVKWNTFDLVKNNSTEVGISFGVTSQINNDWFYVERSTDGITFTSIARIKGELNSNELMKYGYTDYIGNLPIGFVYYRIKQVDTDGKFSITDVKSILNNDENNLTPTLPVLNAYPNPFTDKLYINCPETNTGGELQLYDKEGRLIKSVNIVNQGDPIEVNTESLEQGLYIIKLNGLKAIKVIKTY